MNELIGTNAKGESVLILVLEPGNFNLLREGRPISKRIEDYFPEGIPRKLELVIHFSETPISDSKEFAKMAKMTLDERGARKVRPHCPECKSTIEQLGVWRSDSPLALVFCAQCGCIFGMAPQEVMKNFPRSQD